MPITPYSTPIMTEYKPLGLDNFIAPLSKLQDRFDKVQEDIAATDFDLKHLKLGTDPQKAAELLKVVRQKRDEIAKNLLTSNNYKQAHQQLLRLKNVWEKDPEKLALASNYEQYLSEVKKAEEKVSKGEWTMEEYDQELALLKHDYESKGGTSFSASEKNPEGTYNSFGKFSRLNNKDKEIREITLKVASMLPAQKRSYFKSIGIDPDLQDKEFVQGIIEEIDGDKAAKKIEGFLRQQPDFKAYYDQKEDYNFRHAKINGTYDKMASSLVGKALVEMSGNVQQQYQLAKTGTKQQKEAAKKWLNSEAGQAYVANVDKLDQMLQTGNYDENIVHNLHKMEYEKNVYNRAAANAGSIVAFKNVTEEHIFRDIEPPTENSNGGGGGGYTPFGAIPHLAPNMDLMTVNGKELNENIKGNKSVLNSTLNSASKIGGGIVGKIMGEAKTELGKFHKLRSIQGAATYSKDLESFDKQLKMRGINLSQKDLASLYTSVAQKHEGGSQGFKELNSAIAQGELYSNNLSSNYKTYQTLQKAVLEDKETLTVLNEIGNNVPLDVKNTNGKSTLLVGTKFDKYAYTLQQLKEAGIKLSSHELNMSEASRKYYRKHHTGRSVKDELTFDEVAKLHGFKNMVDAVKHGRKDLFKGATISSKYEFNTENEKFKKNLAYEGMGGSVDQVIGTLMSGLGKRGIKTNNMSYVELNNQDNKKLLKELINTPADLLKYSSTENNTPFKNAVGFDENGNLEDGATLVGDPKLLIWDGRIAISQSVKNKAGKTGMVTMNIRKGSDKLFESMLLNSYQKVKKSGSPDAKANAETYGQALFNLRFGEVTNDELAKRAILKDKNQKLVVGSFNYADPFGNPIPVSIIKYYPGTKNNKSSVPVYNYVRMGDNQPLSETDFSSIAAFKSLFAVGE